MYAAIFAVIAPIFICAAIGFFWRWYGQPFDVEFVSRLVMWIGAPCLIVGTLGRVSVTVDAFLAVALAALLVLLCTALLAYLLCRVLGSDWRSVLPPLLFPNSGNMGLPLALFAFGEEGLAIALVIFCVFSTAHFTLGIALLSGALRWRNMLGSPIVYAVLIAAGMVVSGASLPVWLQNTVVMLGDISIPLMLITLGVSLAQLPMASLASSIGYAMARLLLGLLVGLAVAELLDLRGVVRGVVIIQSAMPMAIFNYLLAVRYRRSPEQVAGMVVASTLISFATLPGLMWLVMR